MPHGATCCALGRASRAAASQVLTSALPGPGGEKLSISVTNGAAVTGTQLPLAACTVVASPAQQPHLSSAHTSRDAGEQAGLLTALLPTAFQLTKPTGAQPPPSLIPKGHKPSTPTACIQRLFYPQQLTSVPQQHQNSNPERFFGSRQRSEIRDQLQPHLPSPADPPPGEAFCQVQQWEQRRRAASDSAFKTRDLLLSNCDHCGCSHHVTAWKLHSPQNNPSLWSSYVVPGGELGFLRQKPWGNAQ